MFLWHSSLSFYLFVYIFGCARSLLRHAGSLVFCVHEEEKSFHYSYPGYIVCLFFF